VPPQPPDPPRRRRPGPAPRPGTARAPPVCSPDAPGPGGPRRSPETSSQLESVGLPARSPSAPGAPSHGYSGRARHPIRRRTRTPGPGARALGSVPGHPARHSPRGSPGRRPNPGTRHEPRPAEGVPPARDHRPAATLQGARRRARIDPSGVPRGPAPGSPRRPAWAAPRRRHRAHSREQRPGGSTGRGEGRDGGSRWS
jgi:hypothetical protein